MTSEWLFPFVEPEPPKKAEEKPKSHAKKKEAKHNSPVSFVHFPVHTPCAQRITSGHVESNLESDISV